MILLSPAKTLENDPVKRDIQLSQPEFIKEANYLVNCLKKLKPTDLAALMVINPNLAQLNFERYATWNPDSRAWNYNPALLSFKGEVYRGASAWEWSSEDLTFAQRRLRILSGLFGLLRPLDNIQPYRLEMGTKLKNRRGQSLYNFWEGRLTRLLKKHIQENQCKAVINLASNEYSKALNLKKLGVPVVEVTFKDFHNGGYKFLTVYGKNARGLMTRYIIENRITEIEEIKAFDLGGYVYNHRLSKPGSIAFTKG